MRPDVTKEIDDAIVSIDRSSLPEGLRVRIDRHRDNQVSVVQSLWPKDR